MAREQKILQPEWKLNQDRSFLEKFLQTVWSKASSETSQGQVAKSYESPGPDHPPPQVEDFQELDSRH